MSFPEKTWSKIDTPDDIGWSSAQLDIAKKYSHILGAYAVMIVVNGQILKSWGNIVDTFNIKSIRKSLLSALYGIAASYGEIDINTNLENLGLDDYQNLTSAEKQASIADLLKSRSGIYHPANYETATAKAERPKRSSHEHGTFWYYNNWDFNALGTIFNILTKSDLFKRFKSDLADKIQMEDYNLNKCTYDEGPDSKYPAYIFRLSARDLARFGLLYLSKGKWNNRTIISKRWIEESTKAYTIMEDGTGYGYMWYVGINGNLYPNVNLGKDAISSSGFPGHYLVVIPQERMVVVFEYDNDANKTVSSEEFGKFLKLILDSKIESK